MEQPPFPTKPYDRADEVLAALGLERSLLPVEVYVNGPNHVYVQLPDEAAVAALEPDLAALAGHDRLGTNCFAGSGTRWKTRMFSPSLGVAEDPATGSAAGPLAVHLGRHGVVPVRHRDRDPPGRRDRAAVGAARPRARPRQGGGRRLRRRRRPRAVPRGLMFDSETFGALASPKRLQILEWLKDPRAHFPPQRDGDLVEDGVCVIFIAEKLGVAQPTATAHLKALARAGLVTSKRMAGWTFYKRDDKAIAALKREIRSNL